jgi:cytochrome c peroxidase
VKRVLLLAVLAACPGKKPAPAAKKDAGIPLALDAGTLPPAPPVPDVPTGLPALPTQTSRATAVNVTPEAVALGELLFWETRLSTTNGLACASCHIPEQGFSGGIEMTAAGKQNLRRAQALVNLAWEREFGWDGRYAALTPQLITHVRGQQGDNLANGVARIQDVPGYRAHFARLAPTRPADAALNALAAYVLTRYDGDARFDRMERSSDVPPDVKAGYVLFTGKAQCAVCHTPPLFTDHQYHRLGLVKTPDEGRGRIDRAMQGAFKTPSLRGATLRRSFFHDASQTDLDAAIDYHLAGGIGQGADPSIVDLKPVKLSPAERSQLGTFVRTLTHDMTPNPKPQLP